MLSRIDTELMLKGACSYCSTRRPPVITDRLLPQSITGNSFCLKLCVEKNRAMIIFIDAFCCSLLCKCLHSAFIKYTLVRNFVWSNLCKYVYTTHQDDNRSCMICANILNLIQKYMYMFQDLVFCTTNYDHG